MAFGLGEVIDGDNFDFASVVDIVSEGPGSWTGGSFSAYGLSLGSRISFGFEVAGALGLSDVPFDFADISFAVSYFAAANDLTLGESVPGTDTFRARVDLRRDPGRDGFVEFYYNNPGSCGANLVPPLPPVDPGYIET